jgi:hypothetical protein
MSEYFRDVSYDITPVKNPGKSKGHKGTAPSKTPTIPNLMNPGTYNIAKPAGQQTSGGYAAGWKPQAGRTSQSPAGQESKYQAPRNVGKSSISALPGQYTGVPKAGGR